MKGRNALGWIGAVALYVALALYQLYPAWWDPAHGVVGDWRHPDTISNHWLYRWIVARLLSGRGIVENVDYYVPVGDAPWLAGNGSDAVPSVLLAWLPWPASMTAWIALALVLNGVSGLVLARRLGASFAASTAAGAMLALSPYVNAELTGGRFAQMPLYQLAFFLTAWHALLERAPEGGPTWPDRGTVLRALGAAALYALCAFSYWYHGVWAALLGVTWFAFRPRWRALVPFVPAAVLLVAPFLGLFLAHWSAIPGTAEDAFPHAVTCQASLPPWFPLQGREGFWGPIVLPLSLMLAAAVALVPSRLFRDAGLGWGHRAALAAALLFWALCLGPYPSWAGGAADGVPGPFWVLYGLASPLRRFWWPYRHVAGLVIALLPVAAVGLDRLFGLLARFTEPGLRPWIPAIAAAAVGLSLPADLQSRGGVVAAPASSWRAPEAYAALAELPGDVVLEVPILPARVTGQQTLSYQWVHGKRLLNGHAMWVDRVRPVDWDAFVEADPLLSALRTLERGEATQLPLDVSGVRAVGLRWIVVNDEYFPGTLGPLSGAYRSALSALFGEPTLDDHGVSAWDVDTVVAQAPVDVPATPLPPVADISTGRVPEYGPLNPRGWTLLTREVPPRPIGEAQR